MKIIPNINTFRGKLYFSMILAIISMLLITALYNYGYELLVNQTAASTFDSLSDEMETRLNVEIELIEEASLQVSYATVIQEYILSDSPIDRFDNMTFAKEVMEIAVLSSDNIENIVIIPYNSSNYLSYTSNSQGLFFRTMRDYGFTEDFILEEPFFSKIYYNDNEYVPYCYYFIPVYNILPGEFAKETIGACAVLCNLEAIAGEIGSGLSESGVAILSYEDEIISTSRNLTDDEKILYNSITEESASLKIHGDVYYIKSKETPDIGWRYTAITAKSKLTQNLFHLRTIGFTLMVLTTLFMAIIISASIRSISRPFRQVIKEMSMLNSGEENIRITVPKEVEVSVMAKEVNKMLERIEASAKVTRETQQQLYDSILAQQKAELLSYRSQINPHFLFNTLECLRSMAQEVDADVIEKMCVSMANIFNYSLYSGNITTLKNEISHTKNYFYVLSQRFPNRYQLKIKIDENDMSHTIPTMVLQPIVENCIKHGFINKKPPCNILIQAETDDESTLIIKVIDNGNGIPANEVNKINNMLIMDEDEASYGQNSIGLHNINQRMIHLFGDEYKIQVKSKLSHYTIIELHIPKNSELSV